MKNLITSIIILFIFGQTLFCQKATQFDLKKRQDKLEIILRLQDSRSIFDGKLIQFLSDDDTIIREKAIFAYANIQDTSVIHLLVDRLTDNGAAFAIGQTAINLCRKSKQALEHDLIWNRIDQLDDGSKRDERLRSRLIEEIGKFGTEDALNDLILRFGEIKPPGLTMSIARFAIRGIVSREAVQYLLKLIQPMESTKWQTVYALQRIGNNSEIRTNLDEIVQLFKHRDPLVRMNLAALLGKVRYERICLEPLQKLADFDGDWRVRVNALRSLSNYNLDGKDDIIRTFKRSFLSGNTNVAVTALSAFGNTKLKKEGASTTLKETFALLEKIAMNKDNEYLWQLQSEAVTAIAKLEGKDAFPFIKIKDYPQPILKAQLLIALGLTGSTDALNTLVEYIGNDKSVLYHAALEGLQELSKKNSDDSTIIEKTYRASIEALTVKDVAIVAAAASILGDSLFIRNNSISPLIECLSNLRVPHDVEAMQEVIASLGELKDEKAVSSLKEKLEERDRSIALAAAAALKSITGQDYSSDIPKYFEPIFTDFDFKYLHSFKDTIRVKMETIRGDIIMELYKNIAPFTVMSFLKLATQRSFYRGLSFHRIVPNFVVQGGDPRGDGWGGPGYSIRSEFSQLTYETGMVGMASSGKDTEGSQFFITQSPQPHLDGRYTIFGKVVSGMDVVNKIQLDDHIFDIKLIQ